MIVLGNLLKWFFSRVADIFQRKFTQLSDAGISFWIELFPNFFSIFLRNCRLISTDEKALFSFNCDGESLKLIFFLMWLTFSIWNLLSCKYTLRFLAIFESCLSWFLDCLLWHFLLWYKWTTKTSKHWPDAIYTAESKYK